MQGDYRRELQALGIGSGALLCLSLGLILLIRCLLLAQAGPAAFFTIGMIGATAITCFYSCFPDPGLHFSAEDWLLPYRCSVPECL